MTYLFDTDVIIDMLRDANRWNPIIDDLAAQGLSISAMTYGELWEGVVSTSERPDAVSELASLLASFHVFPLGIETFKLYGTIRVHLRKNGEMIGTPDILIGSTAIERDLTLVTRNTRHFSRIPNLRIIHPNEFGS